MEATSDGADGETREWSGRVRRYTGRMWRLISGFLTVTSSRKRVYSVCVLPHAAF